MSATLFTSEAGNPRDELGADALAKGSRQCCALRLLTTNISEFVVFTLTMTAFELTRVGRAIMMNAANAGTSALGLHRLRDSALKACHS